MIGCDPPSVCPRSIPPRSCAHHEHAVRVGRRLAAGCAPASTRECKDREVRGLLPRLQAVRDRSGLRRLGKIRWRAQIDSEGGFERGHPAPALGVLRLGGPDAAPHRCRHGADDRVDSNPRTGDTRRAVEAWRPGRP